MAPAAITAAGRGFRLLDQACHRSAARRGDGRTPNATFVHIAALSYLGFSYQATSGGVSPRYHGGSVHPDLSPRLAVVAATSTTALLRPAAHQAAAQSARVIAWSGHGWRR